MKKFILLLIIVCLSAVSNPLASVQADSNTYYISGYDILVEINPDGSALFKEYITYSFDGSFNGILRDVDFDKSSGIYDPEVYVVQGSSTYPFEQSDTGTRGTYKYSVSGTIASFKVYEPSDDEKKTFLFQYKMSDAVIKYNDIAEFNRKLIGTKWTTRIDDVYIKINLPEGAVKEEIRVFGHGPLTGENRIVDARNVELEVPTVSPGVFVEARVLFPPSLIPYCNNIINENVLGRILDAEKVMADEANAQREAARKVVQTLSSVGRVITWLMIPLWLFLIVFIYKKYDKEFKSNFFGKYYRELPDECSPAVMDVLMTFGSVNARDIMATLLDLVRRKHLYLKSEKVSQKVLFGNKEVTTYIIGLSEQPPDDGTRSHEDFLITWFIGRIGNGQSVTLEEIKAYAKDRTNALVFKRDYDKWVGMVKKEAAQYNFFDKKSTTGIILGVLCGILYFVAGIVIPAAMYYTTSVLLIPLGIILFFFSVRIKRRSAYGRDMYLKWNAFKNFLKDFSMLDRAIMPSIVIWEHYLVYAVSLGVAKDVIKQLPLVFREDELNNRSLTYLYGGMYGYYYGLDRMFNDTISTVEGAVVSARSIASSQNSSSSGFGGGFSGGSSGGGGGGGGGGAF